MMGRKRTISIGLPDNLTEDDGRYRYAHPITGKRTRLGCDREKAIARAKKVNFVIEAMRAKESPIDTLTLGHGIDRYIESVVPYKPWDTSTRKNALYKLHAIKRDLGHKPIVTTDRVFLKSWIASRARSGDVFNKWRERFVDLWRYFIEMKWVDFNEPEAVMVRSTSKKLKENQRIRKRLDLPGFWAIHDHETCPHFLRVTMQIGLLLLQARQEACNMQQSHFRDGWLYIIRKKVAGDSDMGFIRVRVDEEIEALRQFAFEDGLLAPYLVHRRSSRIRSADRQSRPHPFYVLPAYATKAFRLVRDATGRWDSLPPEQRPSLHECVSLGTRCYRDAGFSKAHIQALKTHSDAKTTDIYLQGGELKDEHFVQVQAGLRLSDLR